MSSATSRIGALVQRLRVADSACMSEASETPAAAVPKTSSETPAADAVPKTTIEWAVEEVCRLAKRPSRHTDAALATQAARRAPAMKAAAEAIHSVALAARPAAKSIPAAVVKAVCASTTPSGDASLIARVECWLLASPVELRKARTALAALAAAAAVVNPSLHRLCEVDADLEAACVAAIAARPRPCSSLRTHRTLFADAVQRTLSNAITAAAAVLPEIQTALRATVSEGVRGRGDVALRAKVTRVDDTTDDLLNSALDAAMEVLVAAEETEKERRETVRGLRAVRAVRRARMAKMPESVADRSRSSRALLSCDSEECTLAAMAAGRRGAWRARFASRCGHPAARTGRCRAEALKLKEALGRRARGRSEALSRCRSRIEKQRPALCDY